MVIDIMHDENKYKNMLYNYALTFKKKRAKDRFYFLRKNYDCVSCFLMLCCLFVFSLLTYILKPKYYMQIYYTLVFASACIFIFLIIQVYKEINKFKRSRVDYCKLCVISPDEYLENVSNGVVFDLDIINEDTTVRNFYNVYRWLKDIEASEITAVNIDNDDFIISYKTGNSIIEHLKINSDFIKYDETENIIKIDDTIFFSVKELCA